jgi:hypothetical protein
MVDLGVDVTVKTVKLFNQRDNNFNSRLSYATVSLIDSAGNVQKKNDSIGAAKGIYEFNIDFGMTETDTIVNAWKSPSPTGEPLLSDDCKKQLKTQFNKTNDLFDKAIALVFGEKTTIGQVCSFAKGLASNTVTAIPGFCCLDAPYQSKIEEWGEKVSSWDARMKKEDWYCDVPAKLTT